MEGVWELLFLSIRKAFEGTEMSGIYSVPGFLFWFLGFPCFWDFSSREEMVSSGYRNAVKARQDTFRRLAQVIQKKGVS